MKKRQLRKHAKAFVRNIQVNKGEKVTITVDENNIEFAEAVKKRFLKRRFLRRRKVKEVEIQVKRNPVEEIAVVTEPTKEEVVPVEEA